MIIGVPKEIKKQEHRVALLPSAAYQLTKRGHQVLVEAGAGAGAGFADQEYRSAGATLVADAAERSRTLLIGATGEPAAQSALYATASDALIGEELFAAPAYFANRPAHVASLAVQDVFRWLIIAAMLLGAVLKFLGSI